MSHFKKDCAGHCMDSLAINLNLHHPAKEVPHKLEFDNILTEVLFALGAGANPMVLQDVRCCQKVRHPIDMVLVGAQYKVKRLDESEEFEGEQEEADDALRGTNSLTPWERKGITEHGNPNVKREGGEENDDVLCEEQSAKKSKSN
ncbi:hypothetical protein PQX77_016977 [Marasmius sp. AFHP31]|nr:hypothetical protein PQX77_016977 [Marasmius sp. AFHP31]